MANNFEIREHNDILDELNAILRNEGIAELKMERHSTPVVVEIRRTKRIPPKEK